MVRLRVFASVVSFLGVAAAPACGGGFTAASGDGGAIDGAPLDSPAAGDAPADAPETGPSCAPLFAVPNPETCLPNSMCNAVMAAAGSSVADRKFPFGIASGTDGYVYWAAQDDLMGMGTQGAIWRAKKDGSIAPLRVVGATAPTAVALDAGRVYWIDNGSNPSTLYTASLTCANACTATTIGSSAGLRAIRVVADGDVFASGDSEVLHYVYSNGQWTGGKVTQGGPGSLLAYDGLAVFFSSGGTITRIPVDGMTPFPFAAGDGTTYAALESDCTTVFAAISNAMSAIRAFPVPMGASTLMSEPLLGSSVNASAIDRQYLYYGLLNLGGVVRVRRNNLNAQIIAPGYNAWAVAVDETSVYFGDQVTGGGGNIYRVVK